MKLFFNWTETGFPNCLTASLKLENETKLRWAGEMNNKVTDRQRDRFPDGRVQGQVVPEFADPGSGKSVLNALEKNKE